MRAAVTVVLLAIAAANAHGEQAQPVAVAPRAESPHPHAGFGGGVAIGVAGLRGGERGWVARLDYELLPALALPGTVGGAFGFGPSFQYWRAGDDWGLGLPVAIALGVRAPGVRVMGQVGVEVVFVDVVADDTGVGLYAPFAGASARVEVKGWSAGLDARLERRWQIGAPDHTQWQAAITVGRLWETRLDGPVR